MQGYLKVKYYTTVVGKGDTLTFNVNLVNEVFFVMAPFVSEMDFVQLGC